MDSMAFEASVAVLDTKYLSEVELLKLQSLYMPHNGYLRFAHHIIYSFDPTEEPGTPLEFKPFPVEFVF